MNKCTECGSYAINHHCHGRDGSDPELCDVCYWRVRATGYAALEAECERLRVKLMTIASAEPARHGIEWAKAHAAEGNNEVYAKWREAIDAALSELTP